MAVPRLALLLIAGVLLVPAAFIASRQAVGSGGGEPPPSAKAPSAAKPPAAKADPKRGSSAGEQSRAGAGPSAAGVPRLQKDPSGAARRKASVAGFPAPIAAALAKNQTVVLLVTDGKSADDRSTANAVRALKGRAPKTRVFTDRLRNLGDYRLIVGGAGVSQSPSVVIIGRGGKAQVVEGYVDPETLLQRVRDARS